MSLPDYELNKLIDEDLRKSLDSILIIMNDLIAEPSYDYDTLRLKMAHASCQQTLQLIVRIRSLIEVAEDEANL